MIQTLRGLILRRVLEDPEMKTLISDRFYPSYLPAIKNPQFPCANFAIITGGALDPNRDRIANIPFRIWVWSKRDLEEAYRIYERIFSVLSKARAERNNVVSILEETARPFDSYEPVDELFFVVATWVARTMRL